MNATHIGYTEDGQHDAAEKKKRAVGGCRTIRSVALSSFNKEYKRADSSFVVDYVFLVSLLAPKEQCGIVAKTLAQSD